MDSRTEFHMSSMFADVRTKSSKYSGPYCDESWMPRGGDDHGHGTRTSLFFPFSFFFLPLLALVYLLAECSLMTVELQTVPAWLAAPR